MAKITFKAKPVPVTDSDGSELYKSIKVPKLGTQHCDMEAFRTHSKYSAYANSDMFNAVLSRIKRGIGEYIKSNDVPDNVSVDTSGYLAIVTIEV